MEMKRKNLLFGVLIVGMIAFVVWGLFAGLYHRLNRDAIVVQIDDSRPVVALTFDDGPNPRYTPQVLDILYDEQVPATFFLVGEKLSENKLLVQEIALSGHEIGSHTFSHADLTTLDTEGIQREIQQTADVLHKILPDYTIEHVRPPYGRYTPKVQAAIDLPLILWTIDSGDWENPDAERIYTTVVNHIQDGDTIVFHDDNPQTVAALKKIITELKTRGYQFVTVSQLRKRQSEESQMAAVRQ